MECSLLYCFTASCPDPCACPFPSLTFFPCACACAGACACVLSYLRNTEKATDYRLSKERENLLASVCVTRSTTLNRKSGVSKRVLDVSFVVQPKTLNASNRGGTTFTYNIQQTYMHLESGFWLALEQTKPRFSKISMGLIICKLCR